MNDDLDVSMKCGCYTFTLFINFILGGLAFNYLIDTFFNSTIPFFWSGVIGLFTGPFVIICAFIVYILQYFGAV